MWDPPPPSYTHIGIHLSKNVSTNNKIGHGAVTKDVVSKNRFYRLLPILLEFEDDQNNIISQD